MPAVSHCPRCQGQVSLPQGVEPQARVRCPLCQGEYPLAEALRTAPPELILLDAVVRQTQHGDDQPWLGWDEATPASETAESEPAEPANFSSVTAVATGAPAPSIAPLSRPRSGASGGFGRQLVGIVGGGALGLLIGYFLLLWIGGRRADFLEIGQNLPEFMVPAEFHASGGPTYGDEPLPPLRYDAMPRNGYVENFGPTPNFPPSTPNSLWGASDNPQGLPPEPPITAPPGAAPEPAPDGGQVFGGQNGAP
ncbi:MAG: IBR domain-containing protein [Pirellulales bacterium]